MKKIKMWMYILRDLFSDRLIYIGMDENDEPMYCTKRSETMMVLWVFVLFIIICGVVWFKYK